MKQAILFIYGKTKQVITSLKLQRVFEKLNSRFVSVKILSMDCLLVPNTVKNTTCIMKAHLSLTCSEGFIIQMGMKLNEKWNGGQLTF